jgi:hypothetical protein
MPQQAMTRNSVVSMRYVVVDLAGNQRESFVSWAELVEELKEGLRSMPTSLRSLYVLTYDDEGQRIGSAQRGDELLTGARRRTFVFDGQSAASGPGTLLSTAATTPILERARPVAGSVGRRSQGAPA